MALSGFERAAELDPEWEDPKEERRRLIDYLQSTQEYIEKKVTIMSQLPTR